MSDLQLCLWMDFRMLVAGPPRAGRPTGRLGSIRENGEQGSEENDDRPRGPIVGEPRGGHRRTAWLDTPDPGEPGARRHSSALADDSMT